MAVLLFSVGTFALVAGLVMVGFGIPINEFSFGNTLISAGTTAAVGGLIIIALGVVVGQLRRIAESLAGDLPARFAQPTDSWKPRVPSPTSGSARRPRAHPGRAEDRSTPWRGFRARRRDMASDDGYDQFAAPTLPNPEEAPMAVEDEISLSPPQPSGGSPPQPIEGPRPGSRTGPVRLASHPDSPARWIAPRGRFSQRSSMRCGRPRRSTRSCNVKSSGSDKAIVLAPHARGPTLRHRSCQTSRARSAKAARRRHSEVRRRRRNGLHALCRWLDRGGIATRHIAVRLDQRTAKSPRKEFLARAGLHLLPLFLVFLSRISLSSHTTQYCRVRQ